MYSSLPYGGLNIGGRMRGGMPIGGRDATDALDDIIPKGLDNVSGQAAKAVFVKNPQIDITEDFKVPILYGPKTVRKQVTTSTNVSTSSIGYSEKIPMNNLVDRRLFIKTVFTGTLTGTASSGNIWKQGTDAPRYLPLHQSATSIEAKFNGESVTTPSADYISALGRYFNDLDYRRDFTGAPAMLDQSQAYSQTATSPLNPLGEYIGNDFQPPRGCQNVYFTIANNTGSSADFTITSYEPVMVSPFKWGHSAALSPAFANLTTLDLNYTLGNLSRIWSHDNVTNPVTNFAVNVTDVSSELHYTIISPQEDRPVNPMATYFYDYYNIQRFPTTVGSVSAGATSTVTTGMLNPPNVPSRFYIFLRDSNATRTDPAVPDAFANISAVTVQWNNETFLSSASEHDLWHMSKSNGLVDNWVSWKNYAGSVCCFEMGKDIGLNMLQVPGMVLNNQLQLTITFKNLSGRTVNYQAFIVCISPGAVEIRQGSARANIGVISASDILIARQSPFLNYQDVVGMQPYGGSFWSSLADIGKKVWSGVKDVARGLSPVANAVAPFLPYGSQISRGIDFVNKLPGGAMLGNGMRRRGGARKKKGGRRGGYVNEQFGDLMERLAIE